MDYAEFANNALEEFKEIQARFRAQFKIDDYTNWYYDQATELLTFSTDTEEINFKFIPIGTYSTKTESWMWAWRKAESMESAKNQTLKVKDFGIQNGYEKLSEGYLKSDKYQGWEALAISNQILHGIGGYRVESDHLEIYMLVMAHIENEVAHKIKEQIIACERHGAKRMTFICQHLNRETKTGFEEAFPTYRGMELEADEDLQAWCDLCEVERLRTDGWDEESMEFADIKVVCEDCYFEIKAFNLAG